ncbi:HGGxSTG domain-containing protein [Sphingomonas oligophenolica]|uniref:HGGxSTG domain-containing protein n=1 Tax=Sphingomonas oligophenolica TaxID=301154 RepID=UPI003CC8146B
MNKAHAAPRCLAKTRAGTACQSPAMKGRARCRLHRGKASGAPMGNRNAWKHGARSGEMAMIRALVRSLTE